MSLVLKFPGFECPVRNFLGRVETNGFLSRPERRTYSFTILCAEDTAYCILQLRQMNGEVELYVNHPDHQELIDRGMIIQLGVDYLDGYDGLMELDLVVNGFGVGEEIRRYERITRPVEQIRFGGERFRQCVEASQRAFGEVTANEICAQTRRRAQGDDRLDSFLRVARGVKKMILPLHCSNPDCDNVIHDEDLSKEIRRHQGEHKVQAYCCDCFEKNVKKHLAWDEEIVREYGVPCVRKKDLRLSQIKEKLEKALIKFREDERPLFIQLNDESYHTITRTIRNRMDAEGLKDLDFEIEWDEEKRMLTIIPIIKNLSISFIAREM